MVLSSDHKRKQHLCHCGVVVITTTQLHLTKPELRFCSRSNPTRGVSKIRDGEDLWQCSRPEMRLSALRRSSIPQKQFIIIIIIIIIINAAIDLNQVAEILKHLKYYESVKNKLFWMAKVIQTSIYQLWQKSFRILIVTILLILWSYPIDPCFVYFVEFILYLERGSILDA